MSIRRWGPALVVAGGLFVGLLAAPVLGPGDAVAQEAGWTGNINVSLGGKALEEDDWAPADSQAEAGVEADFRPMSWPVSLVIGLRGGTDEGEAFGIELESTTTELSAGVKKIWEPEETPIRPYIGGGLALVSAEATGRTGGVSVSDDDSSLGFWLGGGIYLTLAERLNLGVDIRYSDASVTVFDIDVDAGGTHFAVFLGYHF